VLADWQRDEHKRITGLIIHFQNAGNTPAFQLYVNLLPTPGALPSSNFAHLRPQRLGSWVTGDVVAAHSTLDKAVLNFAGKHIDDVLTGAQNWRWSCEFEGNFEYINIFGEYCCEPFALYLEYGRWWSTGGPAHKWVCPDWPSVSAQQERTPEDELAERFNNKSAYFAGTTGACRP
jgi:hypothetical protein